MKYPTAASYDAMTVEKPGREDAARDVLPVSKDAIKARVRAIREGRLTVTPTKPAGAPTPEQEAAGVAAKLAAKAAEKPAPVAPRADTPVEPAPLPLE